MVTAVTRPLAAERELQGVVAQAPVVQVEMGDEQKYELGVGKNASRDTERR